YQTHFKTSGLQRNKFRHKDQEYFDTNANLLLLKNQQNEWMGGMVNYQVHGNSHRADNLYYSSDSPGAIEAAMERRLQQDILLGQHQAVMLFMSGAQGDVDFIERGREAMFRLADQFVEQAEPHLSKMKPVGIDQIKIKREKVFL